MKNVYTYTQTYKHTDVEFSRKRVLFLYSYMHATDQEERIYTRTNLQTHRRRI